MAERRGGRGIGFGIAGLGTAGIAMLAAALRHPGIDVVGLADPQIDALCSPTLAIARHKDLLDLLADPAVDAVHVATPTHLHFDHVSAAFDAGKHVVVEKPVTANTESARALQARQGQIGLAAIVGHSESFEPYVRKAAQLLGEGSIGRPVAASSTKATTWLARPRAPEELDPATGGGLVLRQGVHQVDALRTVLAPSEWRVTGASRVVTDGIVAAFEAAVEVSRDRRSLSVSILHDARHGGSGVVRGVAAKKRERGRVRLAELARSGIVRLGESDQVALVVLGTEGTIYAGPGGVVACGGSGSGAPRVVSLDDLDEGRHAVLRELVGVVAGGAAVHDLAWATENLRLCEEIERVARATRGECSGSMGWPTSEGGR